MHFYGHMELIQCLLHHDWAFNNEDVSYLLFTTLKMLFKA